jgi:hypothetical protein
MIKIDNKFNIGDIVYLKTDKDQDERIVCAITVYKNGDLVYKLSCGIDDSSHYEFEMTKEKNILKAIASN